MRNIQNENNQFDYNMTSLFTVISEPSQFNGKAISVVGFFSYDENGAMLYNTKDYYDYKDFRNGIYVRVPEDARLELEKRKGFMLEFLGTFKSLNSASGGVVGELMDIEEISVKGVLLYQSNNN